MPSLLGELEAMLSQRIADKGLRLEIEIDDNLPVDLILDKNRLRQILINLIGNAIKFTDSGYIRLHASLRDTDAYDTRSHIDLMLQVEDTGIGIPDEQQSHIFDAFEQVTGQKTETYGGSGLGLTISRELAEMMGGGVSVESEVGKGSIFSIILPKVEIVATEVLRGTKPMPLNLETISFEPATILIADDTNYNCEILTAFLDEFDFNFIYAKNGRQAIEQAREHHPDLILLDMKMPVMDGYEAAELLGKDDDLKGIRVIAVTASAFRQDEATIRKLCDGYLSKPVSKHDLIRKMMDFLPFSDKG
ncbi:hypothetical protein BVY04_00955 [bacterium M21]|nr:hypothetical protein BVY04_00955 [bacterium M21]